MLQRDWQKKKKKKSVKHKYSSPPQGFCKALTPEACNFPFQIVEVRIRFPLLQGGFLDHGISPLHLNILKRPSLWVGRCGFHANAGLWTELSELPGRSQSSLSQTRLLNKTNDLTALSFLPVGHIQAGLESPNIQRVRGAEVEHKRDRRPSVNWKWIVFECFSEEGSATPQGSNLYVRPPVEESWTPLLLKLTCCVLRAMLIHGVNNRQHMLHLECSNEMVQRVCCSATQQHDSNPCSVSLLTRQ